MIAKDALVGLRSALAIRRGLPRPDAVCSAVQMQDMAKCGAVVSDCGVDDALCVTLCCVLAIAMFAASLLCSSPGHSWPEGALLSHSVRPDINYVHPTGHADGPLVGRRKACRRGRRCMDAALVVPDHAFWMLSLED